MNNYIGFKLFKVPNIGKGNIVYHNDIIGNQQQVAVNQTYAPSYVTNGTDIVFWDNGVVGNYWSDYNGTDNNTDKIGDSPYIIDGNNQDNYPLMEHIEFVTLKTQSNLAISNMGNNTEHNRHCAGSSNQLPTIQKSKQKADNKHSMIQLKTVALTNSLLFENKT